MVDWMQRVGFKYFLVLHENERVFDCGGGGVGWGDTLKVGEDVHGGETGHSGNMERVDLVKVVVCLCTITED